MNIYARYFDNEIVVHSLDELFCFLASLQDINVDDRLIEEITTYINSDISYPKRQKVRPHIYFILIKTTANSLEEFKANNKNANSSQGNNSAPISRPKDNRAAQFEEERIGWYLGRINFKRVILIPGTQKFQYRDTTFAAYVHAVSAKDCYDRMIDHLKNRQDVDDRSQFPSHRGANYTYEFVGDYVPVRQEQSN